MLQHENTNKLTKKRKKRSESRNNHNKRRADQIMFQGNDHICNSRCFVLFCFFFWFGFVFLVACNFKLRKICRILGLKKNIIK